MQNNEGVICLGKKVYIPKLAREVIIGREGKKIENVEDLELVGRGIDGIVLKLNEEKVIKILKDNIELQKELNKMTYQKVIKFMDDLDLKRIIQPRDILYNNDGVYVGYVMDYVPDITSEKYKGTPTYREPGDFTCGDLIDSFNDFEEDFARLSEQKIQVEDINDGSFLFSRDFMYLCDMDKYLLDHRATDINRAKLNFTIARFLCLEMKKNRKLSKDDVKTLNAWVKKMSNSYSFKKDLEQEIGIDYRERIADYADEKVKSIIKHR